MRTLEWLMVVLSTPAIAWTILFQRILARSIWPLWVRLPALLAILVLPLHVVIEGAHWQMIPIYLAILLICVELILDRAGKRIPWMLSAPVCILILAGLAISYTLPMFHLPKPTGPYAIGTRTLHLIDKTRMETHPRTPHINREVVVQIWYPSATTKGTHAVYRQWKETDPRSTYQAVLRVDALQDSPVAAGQFPVVLFNHAWRGFRNRSTYIMQELASQGFIVVGISHPWNSAIVQLHDGRIADGRSQVDLGNFYLKPPLSLKQRIALSDSEMRIQTDDDKFVLDQLTALNQSANQPMPSPLAGHLDLNRIGAFGHSFGGSVAAELANEDPRVASVIILDGVLTGPVATSGLHKPLFRIMAETTVMPAGSENSPVESTRVHAQMSQMGEKAITSSFQRFGGYQVVIGGIDHENFSDKGFFSPFHSLSGIGTMPEARAATIINSYILAFFRQTLRNQAQPLLNNEQAAFPEVLSFQRWPSPQSSGQNPSASLAKSKAKFATPQQSSYSMANASFH